MHFRKLKNSELNRLSEVAYKQAPKTPLILVLDNVRSLHNVGSVFRTADAFRLEKIYLCGITATPPHKDIHKTALGATQTVSWEYAQDTMLLLQDLKKAGHNIVAIEQTENATALQDYKPIPKQTTVFVYGNEVKGVQSAAINLCNEVVEIPQIGSKHSLNIAVSVGVTVWDFYSKLLPQ